MFRTATHCIVLLATLLAGQAGAQSLQLLGVAADGTHTKGVDVTPVDREIEDLVKLARDTRTAQVEWTTGKPLSEGRNAHKTNTKQQMKEALEHDYNFLECDVREEINAPHALEVRHDEGQETGDNLTLRQWLAIGLASGRGLKLDVKEAQHMARIIAEVQASGVEEGRLMFNLGYDAMATWGTAIRAAYPHAWLAVNPPSGDGKLEMTAVDQMLAQGRQFGAPVTFVVRFDLLKRDTLAALRTGGPVSVWNSPFDGPKVKDAAALIRSLKANGVNGVVDIRKSGSLLDRVEIGVDWAKHKAGEVVGSAVDTAGSVASTVVDAAGSIIHAIPGL